MHVSCTKVYIEIARLGIEVCGSSALILGIVQLRHRLQGNLLTSFRALARASGPNICIVLFLTQQDGQAMRIVAKRQNGTVILEIPFTKPVTLEVGFDGVIVNGQKILLDDNEDVQHLFCLVQAANIYLFQRRATHYSLQAFTFWLILVAVQHGHKELLSALYSSIYSSNAAPAQHESVESQLYQVTKTLARSLLEGDFILGPRYGFHKEKSARDLGLLYWAIWIGNSPLVNLLMLEGVTAIDNPWHKLPPLHIAALYGHDAVAHTIVAISSEDAQTLAQKRDKTGLQALYYAAWYGHEEVARSLLSWGAEVHHVWNHKQTALHVVAQRGHTDVIQLLLDNGAREDASDIIGMTPLLLACQAKRESVIALFAERKLNFTFRDGDGRNAWQLAIMQPHPQHLDQDQRISHSTFDLLMQHFWAGETPQTMPLPKQRRAIVSFEVDASWATLTLDSRYAKFEHPRPLPSQAIDMFGRCIEGRPPAGITNRLFILTIECHIIYACKTLDFSTTHGQLSRNESGWIRLKIRGGGGFEASVRDMNNLGFISQNHRNIATDPDAEEVSRAAGYW